MSGTTSIMDQTSSKENTTCAYQNASLQRAARDTKVAVVGAGFLGKCIAIDLSLLGVQVVVCDINPQTANALSSFVYEMLHPLLHLGYVTKSMVTQACSHITVVTDVAHCSNADIVIEAIPENMEAKVKLFKTLESHCSASTILATSTIDLSIDMIQRHLQHPDRFLGLRFFYPCVLVSPVELTIGTSTSQKTVDRVVALMQRLEKQPHRGPTKRVLSTKEASAFQFDTAVRGKFYHGLLPPKRNTSIADIITPHPGPPLIQPTIDATTKTQHHS
ncbi:3-hydroxybutyryl-dehydrogenase [Plasmopara halstedii]|uniref:3-hydroxybutyryl-dehydrogenase n=1 Tax=Plasmopara halstedii TaxID=4781 RepID=A0A0P1AAH0_PLAHL|nr:3-hydroxybutyryl-dehydrogenase [Plasmopara halstedii]CEG37759.1 3-hydroxybutyryl-dehydrogenase [Plasmopara halstedii]|eukprot:XP_024574128.1 3-hydroxybutyryl-dehydrogenase [Plasmopara halstedii]